MLWHPLDPLTCKLTVERRQWDWLLTPFTISICSFHQQVCPQWKLPSRSREPFCGGW